MGLGQDGNGDTSVGTDDSVAVRKRPEVAIEPVGVDPTHAATALPSLIATGRVPSVLPSVGRVATWRIRRVERGLALRPGPRRGRSMARRLATDVVRGAMLIVLLNLFVLQISIVRGHSMEPSLHDGDRLVVDRLAYTLTDVARFDVVVLRYPRDPDMDFVKRIVALPGESVAISGGTVFVDGDALREGFEHVNDRTDMRELIVPPDHYFVLGDNRPISCDSREFGLVENSLIRGKVRVRFWPPARLGTL